MKIKLTEENINTIEDGLTLIKDRHTSGIWITINGMDFWILSNDKFGEFYARGLKE